MRLKHSKAAAYTRELWKSDADPVEMQPQGEKKNSEKTYTFISGWSLGSDQWRTIPADRKPVKPEKCGFFFFFMNAQFSTIKKNHKEYKETWKSVHPK